MGEIRPMTDLERCREEGISLLELLRRRKDTTKRIAGPAAEAYRKAFAAYLAKHPRRRNA